jgi:(p)ppGpp synthase/HD superfamily hydrolase
VFFSNLVNRASEFAASAHRTQLRKGSSKGVPYIQHCFMVGFILQRAGFPDSVVAAGILHDVLEDTEATGQELEALFGADIAGWVNAVSEQDKSLPWEVRKARYLEILKSAPFEAMAIATADKIHNISSLIRALKDEKDVWSLFRRGRTDQLSRFRTFIDTLGRRWEHPLLVELTERLSDLESLD